MNGGTGITPTVSAATNTLFSQLTSAGLYSKLNVFYPMLGGTVFSNQLNGNRTSGTTYDLSLFGGFSYSSSGTTGNGINGYGDTGYNNQLLLQDDYSWGVYQFSNTTPAKTDEIIMGVRIGTSPPVFQLASEIAGVGYFTRSGNDNTATAPNSGNRNGFYIVNRTNSTGSNVYRNGNLTPILSVSGTYTKAAPGGNFYVWNWNQDGAPYFNSYANQGLSFIFIGKGLTNTEITNLSNIINTFQTTLGRNTYS